MDIDPRILNQYSMNEEQKAIVSHKQGPLLVIAGPGSGKTQSITLLAMNLLLCGDAKPSEIVLCTYTEKAAFEIQDRLTNIAHKVGYSEDLSQMRVGTIHSICSRIISERIHHTQLSNGYEMLEQFPQQLLIFEHLDDLCNVNAIKCFSERWGNETRWGITKRLQFCFTKIVEELIFEELKEIYENLKDRYKSEDERFLYYLTYAYYSYQKILGHTNRMDFAHIQKVVYNLLVDPQKASYITQHIRYVLVDEYQDTNHIQEQIVTKLAAHGSLCVVGDEDQALYRFRGATVRNILEFAKDFPNCKQVQLHTNYRSHPTIINTCNSWMESIDWSNSKGTNFRSEKTIQACPERVSITRQAVFSMIEESVEAEAEQFANMVATLKEVKVISDYSHVALLLNSVRPYMSDVYIEALEKRKIPVFCPRGRTYFDQKEIRLMIGCLARLFNYEEEKGFNAVGNENIIKYIKLCFEQLTRACQSFPALGQQLDKLDEDVKCISKSGLEKGLADYFYRLLAVEPFVVSFTDPSQIYNLILFSRLLHTFQGYYRSPTTIEQLQHAFFNTFLRLLYEDGVNLYEDAQQLCPPGHVQILTIHQSKGLEFPVVVVGRLDRKPQDADKTDKLLKQFYHHRRSVEPEDRIPRFDLFRNYYVAFSRAEHLLVLAASKQPNQYIEPLIRELPKWAYADKQLTMEPPFIARVRHPLKQRFGFTTHIRMYESCPRRYQYHREYKFFPSYTGDFFLGQVVHHTVENIHRTVRDGNFDMLNKTTISEIFGKVVYYLEQKYMHFNDESNKKKAFQQIISYFLQNQSEIQSIEDAEVVVSVEKDEYILTGKIDLLMRVNGKLHVLDFKTRPRPDTRSNSLSSYERQLYTYAHVIEQRSGELPERLFIYWMGEPYKKDALMEIPYQRKHIEEAGLYFDSIVTKIKQKQFEPLPPERDICNICDIRGLCMREGVI